MEHTQPAVWIAHPENCHFRVSGELLAALQVVVDAPAYALWNRLGTRDGGTRLGATFDVPICKT